MVDETGQVDNGRVLEVVRELFSRHDVRLEPRGEWLVGANGYAISTYSTAHVQSENDARVRLDFEVALPGGRLITESFAGVGQDVAAAASDAIGNFIVNSLHVFLTAFFGCPPEDQVTVETWEIGGVCWQAVIGNFGTRSSVEVTPPGDLFERIENAIRCSELEHDIHWFRIFFGQMDHEPVASEYLMDNLHWSRAGEALASAEWTRMPEFYSIRNFTVLVRDPPQSPEHLEASCALETGLDILMKTWAMSDIGDSDTYRILTNAGIDGDTAERLITFVPVGFSSVVLKSAQLPSTYEKADANGKPVSEHKLDDEPAFRLARERAQRSPRDLLLAIASRCAMMNAVMNSGARPENLNEDEISGWKFAPLLVFIPRFSPPAV